MKRVLLGALFAVFLLGSSQPSEAMVSCTTDLLDCYQSAAAIDSFWYRWAAGLDCELSFVECGRIAIMG